MQAYAMLHCHTEHSLKDSPLHIKDFVKRAKEMGCKALAITDHGTGTGLIEFKKCCEKNEIKPILGVELYVNTEWNSRAHLIVLAKNKRGYEKMSAVLSMGWDHPQEPVKDNFIPVNTMDEIKLLAGGDCYITSACVSGVLSSIYIYNKNNIRKRSRKEEELKKYVSPEDEYYCGNIKLLEEIEAKLIQIEKEKEEKKSFLSENSPARIKARKKALSSYCDEEQYNEAKQSIERIINRTEIYKEELSVLSENEKNLKEKYRIISREIKKAQKEVNAYIEIKSQIDQIPVMSEEDIKWEMEKMAKEMKDIFGDSFFIELQYHGMKEEKNSMVVLSQIADKLKIGVIASNDSHVATKEQVDARTLVKTTRFNKWEDTTEFDKELYMKSDEELASALLKILPQNIVSSAMENIVKIADSCENFKFESHIPAYIDDTGKRLTEEESYCVLEQTCRENISTRYPDGWNDERENKLVYELSVIRELGYCGYTLIVADFINYAKRYAIEITEEKIGCGAGPGRGSGAGSIVSYLTGITNIDPILYGLKFERYLNKDRVSMPDIDTDFSEETRYPTIEYVRKKYGEECVSGIRTTSAHLAKGAVREAARIAKMERERILPEEEKGSNKQHFLKIGDAIAKSIPALDSNGNAITLQTYADKLRDSFSDEDSINVINKAVAIEGVIKNLSIHAAGIIIGDGKPLREIIPIIRQLKQSAVSCDMVEAEEIGLLKMDFLGLRMLDVITECLRRIKRRTGKHLDIDHITFDLDVFREIFGKGKTNCVFQFESEGMKRMLRQFQPESIEDIILLVAAYRPGPMEFIPEIIDVKNGRKQPEYILSELKNILDSTYGKPIYQEQLMDIFHKCAGFSLGQADIIRRYMSKKKVDKFLEYKPQFIEGFVCHGAKEEDAEAYWDSLEDFAKYAFNKSHAAAYAIVAYQTAYLKYYYPLEYMCACLNYPSATDTMSFLIRECRNMGIEVLPPSINQSSARFEIKDEKILYGLGAIEGVKSAANAVIEERNLHGPFQSFVDFVVRVMPSSDVLKAFIMAGVFDEIAREQRQGFLDSINEYCEIIKKMKDIKKKITETEKSIENAVSKEKKKLLEKKKNYEESMETKKEELRAVCVSSSDEEDRSTRIHNEKEMLGAYISSHPLEDFSQSYKEPSISLLEDAQIGDKGEFVGLIEDLQIKKRKKDGKEIAFFILEDISSDISAICPAYLYEQEKVLIQEGNVVRIRADVIQDEDNRDNEEENIEKKLLIRSVKNCYPQKKPVIASYKGKEEVTRLADAIKKYRVEEGGHPVYVHDRVSGKLIKTKMLVNRNAIELKKQGYIINFLHN